MSKVKICGLCRLEDIYAVNSIMPDYIGFVFTPSRRQVDEKTAIKLKQRLDTRILAAGVFVNQEIKIIADLYKNGVIDIAQLHGDENGEYIKRLKGSTDIQIIKAISIGNKLPFLPNEPDYILFDTLSADRGGTGKIFDWQIIKGLKNRPYFLAGGLNKDNVTEAIRLLDPFCVDVSSSVETNGVKDYDKIQKFVNLVRQL